MSVCMHHNRTHELVLVQDDKGETTLHCARKNGCTDTVKCLLDFIPPEKIHKVLMVKDLEGWTPIQSDSADIVKCMLDCVPKKRRYALLLLQDNDRKTGLHCASENCQQT